MEKCKMISKCKHCGVPEGALHRSNCGRSSAQLPMHSELVLTALKGPSAKWDQRFHRICKELASWSSCLSQPIGAVLVRGKTIIATGYNGPPRGIPHCGAARRKSDIIMFHRLGEQIEPVYGDDTMCPRQRLGFSSGDGLELCPAVHAEANCISNAARTGVVTDGSTLYVSCGIPCKDCLGKLINAGITEVVCQTMDVYDELTKWILETSGLDIRLYEYRPKEED